MSGRNTRQFGRAALCALLIGPLGACGTITRGTHQSYYVRTTPEDAQVETSSGQGCESTPCVLWMKRKHAFDVTITKRGYKPTQARVSPNVSSEGVAVTILGNAIIGGLIGITIDVLDGAPMSFEPNHMDVGLQRLLTLGVSLTDPRAVAGGGKDVRGVIIGSVVSGSVADRAGLRTGDSLTRLNGRPVRDPDDLVDAIDLIQPNAVVQATGERAGAPVDFSLQF